MVREFIGAVSEGVPSGTVLPVGLPLADGTIAAALILVVDRCVPATEVSEFAVRHRFAGREETARAVDSQARWSLESDGRVNLQLLTEDGVSGLALAAHPRVRHWAALARSGGGTVRLMLLPGLASADLATIRRRLGPGGGDYWHLSVGFVPA